ncbi:Glutaredoxin domain-containing protein [Psidium guajava]|nr:Glutaredoxin domain-containing protein [Psidium guajava]
MEDLESRMISEKPMVIFSKSSCCMCHTIKTLLYSFGANPMVHEQDEIPRGREIEQALVRRGATRPSQLCSSMASLSEVPIR